MGCGASTQNASEEPSEPSLPLGTLAGEVQRVMKDFPGEVGGPLCGIKSWWFDVPSLFWSNGCGTYPECRLRDEKTSIDGGGLRRDQFYTVLELAVTEGKIYSTETTCIMALIEDPPEWVVYMQTDIDGRRFSPVPRYNDNTGDYFWNWMNLFNTRIKPEERILRVTGSEDQSVNGIYTPQLRSYTPGSYSKGLSHDPIVQNWAYPIWKGEDLQRDDRKVERYLFYSEQAGAWRIDDSFSDKYFCTSSVQTTAVSPVGLEWDKGTRVMAAQPSKGLVGSAAPWSLEPVAKNSPVWDHLCSMLRVTDPENLGWGRDVQETDVYNALTPVLAWKVSCHSRAQLYETAKDMVKDDIRTCRDLLVTPATQTKLTSAADAIGCDKSINEAVLLHGTKPETLPTILSNGLSEKFSAGLLGKGIYLAEDASKIDQYCTSDSGEALGALHEKMYTEVGIEHPGQVFYAIVVRAVLGFTIGTKDTETNSAPPNQGVFATSDKRELTAIPDTNPPVHWHTLIGECGPQSEGFTLSRHREFAVFNANRVLEDYVVAFRREVDGGLPLPKRQDKPPEVEQEQAMWH